MRELYLYYNNRCNLDCVFCASTCTNRDVPFVLDIVEVVDALKSYGSTVDRVTISGGEPTMEPALRDVVESIREYTEHIVLQTNGIRLADYEYTESLALCGVDTIAIPYISADAVLYDRLTNSRQMHAKYESGYYNALRIKKSYSTRVVLKALVLSANLDQICALPEWIAKYDYNPSSVYYHGLHYSEKMHGSNEMLPDYRRAGEYVSNSICAMSQIMPDIEQNVVEFPICLLNDRSIEILCESTAFRNMAKYVEPYVVRKGRVSRYSTSSHKLSRCKDCHVSSICDGINIRNAERYSNSLDEIIIPIVWQNANACV